MGTGRGCALILGVALAIGLLSAPPVVAAGSRGTALAIADFLLAHQHASGAIPDAPGAGRVNEDSNMEYALIGLAAAYAESGDARYLDGLDRGLAWLAAREELADPFWRGSWYYAYSSRAPYAPLPTSPGPGVRDVRGVDATSALFAYLVALRDRVTGTTTASTTYETQARAALDFVLAHDRLANGLFASSWQLRDGSWELWRFAYAADQGDVELGLRAGSLLYGDPAYTDAADFLASNAPAAFALSRRFAIGMDRTGRLDTSMGGFNVIFPQGYLPWVFGDGATERRAAQWLSGKVRPDGGVALRPRAPTFSLSAAILAMADRALGRPSPRSTLRWLERVAFDARTGGVRDTGASEPEYDNVAGFSIVALLGFPAFA